MKIRFILKEISRKELKRRSEKLSKMADRFIAAPKEISEYGKSGNIPVGEVLNLIKQIGKINFQEQDFYKLMFSTKSSYIQLNIQYDIIRLSCNGVIGPVQYSVHITIFPKIIGKGLYKSQIYINEITTMVNGDLRKPARGIGGGIMAAAVFNTAMKYARTSVNAYSSSDKEFFGGDEWAKYVSEFSTNYKDDKEDWTIDLEKWGSEDE